MESDVRDLLYEGLKDACSAEKQALQCMQEILKVARAPALREGIQMHIEQTQVQIERIEQAMEKLSGGQTARSARRCGAGRRSPARN